MIDDGESDHSTVQAAISDYEENVKPILDRITEKFIKPHVPEKDDQDAMRLHLSSIIMSGRNWLTHEERKKGVRQFRHILQKALDHRDSFSVSSIGLDGKKTIDYPLQRLFCGAPPEDSRHMPFPKGPMDHVRNMMMTCDLILGKEEPKRFPGEKLSRKPCIFGNFIAAIKSCRPHLFQVGGKGRKRLHPIDFALSSSRPWKAGSPATSPISTTRSNERNKKRMYDYRDF